MCDVRQVIVRNIAGDVLAEVPFSDSLTVAQLAEELSTSIPLGDPLAQYAVLHSDIRLLPDSLLSSYLSEADGLISSFLPETIELTSVVERLPWCLSVAPSAKSSNVQIIGEDGSSAKRDLDRGGVVMSERPVPWKNGPQNSLDSGAFSFEVVIDGMSGSGHEGVEVGVTTSTPSSVDFRNATYAVLHQVSWVSSDAGTLWINGKGDHYGSRLRNHEHWRTTRPSALKVGDVVGFSVKPNGGIQVRVNDTVQAVWDEANISIDQPLYAIVGMRAPCTAITLRLPECSP